MEPPNLETIISKKMQQIKNIESRCGENSLCIETCEYEDCLDMIYPNDNNNNKGGYKTKKECLAILDHWKSHTDIFSGNNIQSISIFITGDTDKMKSIGLFTHGFNLINLGFIDDEYKFILCDSWEGIHLMKCRKVFNLEQIVEVIVGLLELNEDITSKFDDLFNNESKTNWEEEIQLLKDMGEYTQTYSSDEIIQSLANKNITNIKYKLDIKTYNLDRIDYTISLGGMFHKKSKRKNKNKKSKTKRKNKNKKSKTKRKK